MEALSHDHEEQIPNPDEQKIVQENVPRVKNDLEVVPTSNGEEVHH